MRDRGIKPHSDEWNAAFDVALAEVARDPRNAGRLTARIPQRRYVCFYPMNKKRDGADNWYNLPFAERAAMMVEHGKIGRSYHGLVTQVISGSIGFDDWEWGVDLYADDPLVFKKLVYEMRFDEASSRFGEFGRSGPACSSRSPHCPIFWPANVRRSCWRSANPHSANAMPGRARPEERLAAGRVPAGAVTPRRLRLVRRDAPAPAPDLVQRPLRRGFLDQPLVEPSAQRGQAAGQISLQPLRARRAQAALASTVSE